MYLATYTSPYDNQPPLAIASTAEHKVYLVPRHLDADAARLAIEWVQYTDDEDNQRALARGGPDVHAVDAERMRRWDDFVQAVTPVLTSRADAMAYIAQLTTAVNRAWPAP